MTDSWTPWAMRNATTCLCTRSINISSDIEIIKNLSRPTNVPLLDGETRIDWAKISADRHTWTGYSAVKKCALARGSWSGGDVCGTFYAPDILFFSVVIFLATFFIAYSLKALKNASFFPSKIRSIISDFAVMIAILICTMADYFMGLHTPKLTVPSEFKPTNYLHRGWLVPFFDNNPWWTCFVALGPALLGTILIFMDQQITAVIVNRRENKLIKGAGYHLDLLIVAITIVINSIIGIPWFVAATVLSLNHVISLRRESESTAPGEKPVFLGCR
ncbi:Electroneutral sodium bicarbonate exchanger 1 [Cichlidogyrus casuarinus]|uniref:Electroneutral sodium bicarbonate exchanger 1 n=1 Tax=Cichlidogyrus casuarinus TaxID=1844966 RepID=A0ABD2Q1C0_9PLAT